MTGDPPRQDMLVCCPTCPPGTFLEEDEGQFWCPAEERAVTYGELRADTQIEDDF